MNSYKDLNKIRDVINDNASFVISSHINPDGDAVGASLGLGLALQAAGKDVKVVINGVAAKFMGIAGSELISGEVDSGDDVILICLDCATLERLYIKERFNDFKTTINIDHHITNTGYSAYNYVDGQVASACEVVFELVEGFLPIDKNIAEALLLGILSDTGGFSHSNTKVATLKNAARLMDTGADITKMKKRVLNNRTMSEAKAFGLALNNMKQEHGCINISYLTKDDFETTGAVYSDLDGIAEYMLEVSGAMVSLFFTERDGGIIKVNFRSMKANVSEVAALYGGGGHINAAGANIEGNVFEVMDNVVGKVWEVLRNEKIC